MCFVPAGPHWSWRHLAAAPRQQTDPQTCEWSPTWGQTDSAAPAWRQYSSCPVNRSSESNFTPSVNRKLCGIAARCSATFRLICVCYSPSGSCTSPGFAQTDGSWEPAAWTRAGGTATATKQGELMQTTGEGQTLNVTSWQAVHCISPREDHSGDMNCPHTSATVNAVQLDSIEPNKRSA